LKLAIFDLDGTITESHKTIYYSAESALKEMNIPFNIDEASFKKFIGMPFKDIFAQKNIPVDNYDRFLKIYLEYYYQFLNETIVYDGISYVFDILKENKIEIALLTTKIQNQAEYILKHFNIAQYFNYTMGRREGIPVKPSPVPIFNICKDLRINPEDSCMVGDTEMDVLAGKNAGSLTVAVTYGYRDKYFLMEYNPDYLIDYPMDFLQILKN